MTMPTSTHGSQSLTTPCVMMLQVSQDAKRAATASTKKADPPAAKPSGIWAAAAAKKGWTCEACLVDNDDSATKCVACETPKCSSGEKEAAKAPAPAKKADPPAVKASGIWAAAATKKGWTCAACLVDNDDSADACVACETPKKGCTAKASATKPGTVSLRACVRACVHVRCTDCTCHRTRSPGVAAALLLAAMYVILHYYHTHNTANCTHWHVATRQVLRFPSKLLRHALAQCYARARQTPSEILVRALSCSLLCVRACERDAISLLSQLFLAAPFSVSDAWVYRPRSFQPLTLCRYPIILCSQQVVAALRSAM